MLVMSTYQVLNCKCPRIKNLKCPVSEEAVSYCMRRGEGMLIAVLGMLLNLLNQSVLYINLTGV